MEPGILQASQSITPFMQYGFAGFCFIQFTAFVWIAYKAVVVISENTHVIQQLNERDKQTAAKVDDIRDRLLSRPCIMRTEVD